MGHIGQSQTWPYQFNRHCSNLLRHASNPRIWHRVSSNKTTETGCLLEGGLSESALFWFAGLGSVIIDSQPLTVAVLAALLFGEKLGAVNISGLFVGVAGLLLLEVPEDALSQISGESLQRPMSLSLHPLHQFIAPYSCCQALLGWFIILGHVWEDALACLDCIAAAQMTLCQVCYAADVLRNKTPNQSIFQQQISTVVAGLIT